MRSDLPHPQPRAARAGLLARRVTTVATGLAVGLAAAPAHASPPSTWEEAADPSTLHFLLIFVGLPGAVIAVLALLTYLPSMIRGQSSEPALVFAQHSEWFGGPRKAPNPEQQERAEQTTGGAGAQW